MLLRKLSLSGVLALAVFASARPAPRMWVLPSRWPTDRLIENLERRVSEHPEDAQGHRLLGRAHSQAFTFETRELLAYGPPPSGPGPEGDLQLEADAYARTELARGPGRPPLPTAESLEHLTHGVEALRRALELDPDDALAHHSLAWLLEHGAHLADRVDSVRLLGPAEALSDREAQRVAAAIFALGSQAGEERASAFERLSAPALLPRALSFLQAETAGPNARRHAAVQRLLARAWKERALEHYARALELAAPTDLSRGSRPLARLPGVDPLSLLTSHEAAHGWLRLAEELERPLAETERRIRAKARELLERLAELPPPGFVTPLVLALDAGPSLDSLIAPQSAVLFDLDGDGREEAWPWLRPGAGLLVWDPEGTGEVRSGRDLFGTASAQLLFSDGYQALAALDDDGNGEVAGGELRGIGVWRDDGDGLSEPGEVVAAEALGIQALGTRPTGRKGRSLVHACGARLAGGRTLPTWDWVVAPLGEPPSRGPESALSSPAR